MPQSSRTSTVKARGDFLVPISDPAACDAGLFGPKAANQAALGRAGLPIPDGFALSVKAYWHQIESLGLRDAVKEAGKLNFPDGRQYVSQVRIGLFDNPVDPVIRDALVDAWHAISKTSARLGVVRSSALIEDRAGASFAGQFESFLGLDNERDFLTAVRACWAAMWSARALKYMDSHDISPADTGMALLIQPLIEARASGGGMSKTADGGMLLSATWGLGEAIAQGEVVPDRYEMDGEGRLLDMSAGRKDHSIHCVHHQAAPAAHVVEDERAGQPCLTPAQAEELAQMVKKAEAMLGRPAEVEWALDDNGFKMLQARPLMMDAAPVPEEVWLRHPGIKGHPSGVGWGAGRACVVNCECELSRIAPGDILITKVAGPALAQVLPRVSGVVAELGGSTSHLASLARERGIPMVLGLLDATQIIPDGSQVGVDGVTGVVRWIN